MPRPVLEESRIHTAVRERLAQFQQDTLAEVQAAVAQHAVVVVGMRQNPYPRRARKALEVLMSETNSRKPSEHEIGADKAFDDILNQAAKLAAGGARTRGDD